MKIIHTLLLCCALVQLDGCATILEGTKQTIEINSEPAGALCDMHRAGRLMANFYTPGTFTVGKAIIIS
ncbi:hypothetical protein NBRC103581_00368 [Gluconobacter wancherniae NBRC 103581]|nr:hypothetical protein NBRC103581_00368 [Gluconobacter wancherniae NBRC 103581]